MPIPEPYPDLFAAAAAWFQADAQLQALLPGGFVSSRGAPAQQFPYCKVGWRKPQPGLSPDDEQYLVTLAVFALDEDEAADIGEALVAAYLSETRQPLVFTDKRNRIWRECRRVEQEAIGPEMVDMIAGQDGNEGGYVWRYRTSFEVWVVPA